LRPESGGRNARTQGGKQPGDAAAEFAEGRSLLLFEFSLFASNQAQDAHRRAAHKNHETCAAGEQAETHTQQKRPKIQRIADVAKRAVGYKGFGVQSLVVNNVGAKIGRRPSTNRSREGHEEGAETEDEMNRKARSRICRADEGPDEVDVIDRVQLKRDPEMKQVEKGSMAEFEISSSHRLPEGVCHRDRKDTEKKR